MADVFIATPTHNWQVSSAYVHSLLQTACLLGADGKSIETRFQLGCAMISFARALLVQDFLDSGAEHLLFIDSDLGWDASGALAIINSPYEFIGGVYPAKTPSGKHLFQNRNLREADGEPELLEADAIPAGFMRVKRSAFLKMKEAYPETRCIHTGREVHLLFESIILEDGTALGEDYAFCERWRRIGGKVFIYPDIQFSHFGLREWKGNMITDDPRLRIE